MNTKRIIIMSAWLCVASLSVQTPDPDPHPDTLRVMTYNVWYAFEEGNAKAEGLEWVDSQTPDVVALQELTNIKPAELQAFATAWGHGYSALLKTSGFSVGLTSRWEIEVVEKGLKDMHHGYLHARTNGVHYVVIHLSPFEWEVREREAGILIEKIKPLLEKKEKVIVLGDFNALSPEDKTWLEASENAGLLESKKESDAGHSHVQNLKDGKFHYGVLDAFFKAGLIDTAKGHLPETFETRLTSPTGVWGDKKTAVKIGERIDFILASSNIYQNVIRSTIITEGVVNKVSDHYPVITDFKER